MKVESFIIDFVEFIPGKIQNGIIYISVKFKIIVHNCACGCGNKIVLPLDKSDGWILKYDGESISLSPSVGNWDLLCKSHYFITDNRVVWCYSWNKQLKLIKRKKQKEKKRSRKILRKIRN